MAQDMREVLQSGACGGHCLVKVLGFQGFVVLLLLMVATMALIYALKYQEDVGRGKAKDDGNDRWWGMM
jgi:hypothetical protein